MRTYIVEKTKKILRMKYLWWIFLLCLGLLIIGECFFGTACFFRASTGVPCPGCGITRATGELFHGHFIKSFMMYPMLIPLIILAVIYAVTWAVKDKTPRWVNILLFSVFGAVIAVYIIRMICLFNRDTDYSHPMHYNRDSALWRIIEFFTKRGEQGSFMPR